MVSDGCIHKSVQDSNSYMAADYSSTAAEGVRQQFASTFSIKGTETHTMCAPVLITLPWGSNSLHYYQTN